MRGLAEQLTEWKHKCADSNPKSQHMEKFAA